MPGRPNSWTVGADKSSLPIVLTATVSSKHRLFLPAEALDKVNCLSALRSGPLDLGLEIRNEGAVRIVPESITLAAIERITDEADVETLMALRRRLFITRAERGGRLTLPEPLLATVLRELAVDRISCVLECHADWIDIWPPSVWMANLSHGATLDEFLGG